MNKKYVDEIPIIRESQSNRKELKVVSDALLDKWKGYLSPTHRNYTPTHTQRFTNLHPSQPYSKQNDQQKHSGKEYTPNYFNSNNTRNFNQQKFMKPSQQPTRKIEPINNPYQIYPTSQSLAKQINIIKKQDEVRSFPKKFVKTIVQTPSLQQLLPKQSTQGLQSDLVTRQSIQSNNPSVMRQQQESLQSKYVKQQIQYLRNRLYMLSESKTNKSQKLTL